MSFTDRDVNLPILRERAYNLRWAEQPADVIPLTAADSDFPVAPAVIEALQRYLAPGYLSYVPKLGYPSFRESISRHLKKKDEDVPPELILPLDSAARGMYVIAETLLQPGDEAIVFDPLDYLFGQAVLAAGGTVKRFACDLRHPVDLGEMETLITPATKMICFCNPHNPFGKVYTEAQLKTLLDLAERHDLWIMNDEIWSDIVYSDAAFLSLHAFGAEKNKRTVSVYGFSKGFGIAGLRAGCVYTQNEAVFERLMQKSHVLTTAGGIASLSQIAAEACLSEADGWAKAFLAHLEGNRDYALARLSAMPKISCHKPEATFLLFPDIRATGLDSQTFVDRLKAEGKLAVVPGSVQFFGPGSEGFIRISYATSRGILSEAMDRLDRFLHNL